MFLFAFTLPVFISGRPSSVYLIIIVYKDVPLNQIDRIGGIIVQVVVHHQLVSDLLMTIVPLIYQFKCSTLTIH